MSVKQSLVTVTSTTYPATADVIFPDRARRIMVENKEAANVMAVSFDGINDHGVLTPGKPSAMLTFEQFTDKVWLRILVGAANCSTQVIAEF